MVAAESDVAVLEGVEREQGDSPPLGHPDASADESVGKVRRRAYSDSISKPVRAVGGAFPAEVRGLSIAQGEVATRAFTTRSGVDTKARCASSCVQADIGGCSDDVAGRRCPRLSPRVTFAVAGW